MPVPAYQPMLRVLATVGVACALAAQAPAPIPVLLVSGANNHDWEWTTPEIKTVLEETGRFAVTVTN
jgi:hypothetical protein